MNTGKSEKCGRLLRLEAFKPRARAGAETPLLAFGTRPNAARTIGHRPNVSVSPSAKPAIYPPDAGRPLARLPWAGRFPEWAPKTSQPPRNTATWFAGVNAPRICFANGNHAGLSLRQLAADFGPNGHAPPHLPNVVASLQPEPAPGPSPRARSAACLARYDGPHQHGCVLAAASSSRIKARSAKTAVHPPQSSARPPKRHVGAVPLPCHRRPQGLASYERPGWGLCGHGPCRLARRHRALPNRHGAYRIQTVRGQCKRNQNQKRQATKTGELKCPTKPFCAAKAESIGGRVLVDEGQGDYGPVGGHISLGPAGCRASPTNS